jgi:tetratricopeptide (TPR) repeat protein
MRTKLAIIWLLLACLSIPLLSRAESPQTRKVVSVRELSIPPKAHQVFKKGIERLARNDAAGSLPHFQRAVAEFASYYEAYFEIGAADLKLGRITEAETAFRRSIELSGSRYEYPMFALGAILDNQGRYAEAEEVIRRGLDLNPDAWNGHYFLGMALFGLNRLDEAEESVREALRQKPDTVESLRLIVNIHIRKRNYSALLEDLDEYLKLDPDSSFGEIARADRDAVQRAREKSQNTIVLIQPQP